MTFSKLGTDTQTGAYVELPQASRRQGLYIIGATGMGKSGLLENLIVEDSKQGLGVCLLDAHGDLTHAVLSRLPPEREKDVILLDLTDYHYPFGLNLFTCSDPTDIGEVSRASSKVMHIFKKLWGKGGIVVDDAWGVLLEEILRAATRTFLEYSQYEVYTMAEIPLLLEDAAFRNHLVQKLNNRHVKNYWLNKYNKLSDKDQLEERRSTLNRLNAFLTQEIVEYIVGQSTTTIDFRRIMDERKIVLVMFDRQMEDVTSLIGSMIIAELLTAANSRKDIPLHKRKQFNVYADEFQLFATEDFATLLTEARKFGIATTVAHQARYQPGMTDGIRATTIAVPNVVVFQISSDDAHELAGKFDLTPPPAREEDIEIIDGTEPIFTPVKDVINHLLNGGSHTNPVVNQFTQGTLRTLSGTSSQYAKYPFLDALNTLLYNAMVQKNSSLFFQRVYQYPQSRDIAPHVCCILGALNCGAYATLFDTRVYVTVPPTRFSPNPEQAFTALEMLWCNPQNSIPYLQGCAYFQDTINEYIECDRQHLIDTRTPPQHIQEHLQRSITNIQQQTPIFYNFFTELKQVMQALATEPIREKSGLEQPRKRIQHIVYAQQSHADKRLEIANDIANLPKFNARVKIALDDTRNVEYKIKTLAPGQGIGKALDQRIATIQAQNRKPDQFGCIYCRPRKEVEAEITKRQLGWSSSPAAQSQSPHARQVPTCPNCGKSNPPGSQFCNQCGTKL